MSLLSPSQCLEIFDRDKIQELRYHLNKNLVIVHFHNIYLFTTPFHRFFILEVETLTPTNLKLELAKQCPYFLCLCIVRSYFKIPSIPHDIHSKLNKYNICLDTVMRQPTSSLENPELLQNCETFVNECEEYLREIFERIRLDYYSNVYFEQYTLSGETNRLPSLTTMSLLKHFNKEELNVLRTLINQDSVLVFFTMSEISFRKFTILNISGEITEAGIRLEFSKVNPLFLTLQLMRYRGSRNMKLFDIERKYNLNFNEILQEKEKSLKDKELIEKCKLFVQENKKFVEKIMIQGFNHPDCKYWSMKLKDL
jgi:hypothetical protein